MAAGMKIPTVPKQRAPRPMAPAKAVQAAPRIKPVSTREYGKGGTPYSQALPTNFGAGAGYGGPSGL